MCNRFILNFSVALVEAGAGLVVQGILGLCKFSLAGHFQSDTTEFLKL